jgi:hypothetical protein
MRTPPAANCEGYEPMTRGARLLTLLLLSAAVSGGCRDEPPKAVEARPEVVKADVGKIQQAFNDGDVETVLAFTHPRLIEEFGGRERVRAELKTAMDDLRGKLSFESLTFPAEPTFATGSTNQFALVPMRTVISVSGRRVEGLSFQLGVRRIGQTEWKYVDGSKLDLPKLRKLFPDFPNDVPLPEVRHRPI